MRHGALLRGRFGLAICMTVRRMMLALRGPAGRLLAMTIAIGQECECLNKTSLASSRHLAHPCDVSRSLHRLLSRPHLPVAPSSTSARTSSGDCASPSQGLVARQLPSVTPKFSKTANCVYDHYAPPRQPTITFCVARA